MNDDIIIAKLMDILDGFENDEEFETFIDNARMLWAARDTAKAIAAGLPASAANN